MNTPKKARNKLVCALYHDGRTTSEIAKIFEIAPNSVTQVLKRWYEEYYPTGYNSPKEKKLAKLEEVKKIFLEKYEPFRYNRAQMARLCNCTVVELNQMLAMNNLHHLRMKTYKSQKTLCNVPDEFFNYIKEYAKQNNTTIRQVAMTAINEYLLRLEN